MQRTLFNDVVLDLTRLTGPPRSVGKDNLTLRRIAEHVSDPELHLEIARLGQAAFDACECLRDRRNRQLAHDDLSLALSRPTEPVRGISRADIELRIVGRSQGC